MTWILPVDADLWGPWQVLVNLYIAPGLMLWPGIALGVINAALIILGNSLCNALEDRPQVRRRRGSSRKKNDAVTPASAEPLPTAGGDAPVDGFDEVPAGSVLAMRRLRVGYPGAEGMKDVVNGVSMGVRRGEVVELGDAGEVTQNPKNDYTRRLLMASPIADPARQRQRREERLALAGQAPARSS